VLKKSRMCSMGLSPFPLCCYCDRFPRAVVHRAISWFSGCAPGAGSELICSVPHRTASGGYHSC
jgi:hypothetical protein